MKVYLRKLVPIALLVAAQQAGAIGAGQGQANWVGTWTAAPQAFVPGALATYDKQTLRLIVHGSIAGKQLRIRISNLYGEQALQIGAAHIALRDQGADIQAGTDRELLFQGRKEVRLAAGSELFSDAVALDVPAGADLAVSIYLPSPVRATTSHLLAMQTSYVSKPGADFGAATKFPVGKTLQSWPFLTGVEVAAPSGTAALVVLGDSQIDGDGSTTDSNHRWPDRLAERFRQAGAPYDGIAVLNKGLVGNRLLHGSPPLPSPFGQALGPAAEKRFESEVLKEDNVRYVVLGIGMNDLGLPGVIAPRSELVGASSLIASYKRLAAAAHQHGLKIFVCTLGPSEGADALGPGYYSDSKDSIRQAVNAWMRESSDFDGLIDLDQLLRDPDHPSRLLARYDSGDHLHPNDVGYAAVAVAIPLKWFAS